MRKYISFDIDDMVAFKRKLVHYCADLECAAVYDSCHYYHQNEVDDKYHSVDFLAGLGHINKVEGGFDKVHHFQNNYKDWLCGYWGYDLKNKLENLSSENKDGLNFPEAVFFQPRYLVECSGNTCSVAYIPGISHKNNIHDLIKTITLITDDKDMGAEVKFTSRVSEHKYSEVVKSVLHHIQQGDIYEMNYCMEFYCDGAHINPYTCYNTLIEISPTPFASFFKVGNKFALCASPERYLKKEGDKVISQPIKGTAKRSRNLKQDAKIKEELASSVKERSENIMIVDLVRNDVSRVAARGSVEVEELCGIYPFAQVFQMISTVSAQLKEDKDGFDAIKATFPAGSMTGAPKIRAMKLIEKYEKTKRGLYSGAIGYFKPDGDFDFNVVIRTLQYDAASKYLSFMVGSAITEKSVPQAEYAECLLKAKAILKLFNQDKPHPIEAAISEVFKG